MSRETDRSPQQESGTKPWQLDDQAGAEALLDDPNQGGGGRPKKRQLPGASPTGIAVRVSLGEPSAG